jgi:hypothetical protein
LVRFGTFIASMFEIVVIAGKISASDWGRSTWRFYGGLLGGIALCGLAGFGLLVLPALRANGLLP